MGNTNALKHGFYSREFRRMDLKEIEEASDNLFDEIIAARVVARKMYHLMNEFRFNDLQDCEALLKGMDLFTDQLIKIGHLLRINHVLYNSCENLQSEINDAIYDVAVELGIIAKQ